MNDNVYFTPGTWMFQSQSKTKYFIIICPMREYLTK